MAGFNKVPDLYEPYLPKALIKRVKYIRYVERVTEKGKALMRVLVIDPGTNIAPPVLFIATTDGRIKTVMGIDTIDRLEHVYLTANKKPTLVIYSPGQQMLLIRTPERIENPTHSKISDIKQVLNDIREANGLSAFLMPKVEASAFKFMKGKKVTAKEFVENRITENKKQSGIDDDDAEPVKHSGKRRDSAGTTSQTVLSDDVTSDPGTEADFKDVEKDVHDRFWEKKIEDKIKEAEEKRRQLRESMKQLRQDVQAAPPQVVLDQAADDASVYDDDDEATTYAPTVHSTTDSLTASMSEVDPLRRTVTQSGYSDEAMLEDKSKRPAERADPSAGSDPPPPTDTVFQNLSFELTEADAQHQLETVPWNLQRAARQGLPRGTWSGMSCKERYHAVVNVTQKKILVTKTPGERLGVVTEQGLIKKVDENSAAHKAGLHHYVGYTLERVNGKMFTGPEDFKGLGTAVEFVLKPSEVHTKNLVCRECGSWVAKGDNYCGGCGKAQQKGMVERRTRDKTLQQLEELARSARAVDVNIPNGAGKLSRADEEGVLRHTVENDLLATYVTSIVRQQEEFSEVSEHESDDGARHGPGERRFWGLKSHIKKHPVQNRLRRLLTERDDVESELVRLRDLKQSLESGECFMNFERYQMHLVIEQNVVHKWLAGSARCKGVTGDPRSKTKRNNTKVYSWLDNIVRPVLPKSPKAAPRVPPAFVRASKESFYASSQAESVHTSTLPKSSSFWIGSTTETNTALEGNDAKMRAAEFTYLVIGLVIGALLNSAMKQGDDHAKPAAQSVQQAPNTVPVPVPVPVPMPVPVPLPVPVPNAHVAASPSDSHDVPTPYVVPKLGTDTRDCNRGPRSKLVIPASEVKAITDWHTYKDLCCYPDSRPDMQRDAMKAWTNPAGKEHYALLSWLSNQFGAQGGAMFAELGSKEGLSAMAMAVHPMVTVFAFDVVSVATHVGSVMSSRNGGKRVTPMDVQKAAPNIHFVAGNLADPASAYWRKLILGSRVLLLDTNHFPESKPFEYEVLKYLDENNYCGILLMDDLNLTGEMKRFWKYIQEKYGDRAIDVTRIGHGSGTGLLDFCGNTVVNWDI